MATSDAQRTRRGPRNHAIALAARDGLGQRARFIAPVVAAGVLFGIVGGTIGNHERFVEVYRGGSHSWIGALALTLPTALVGLAATVLVLRRHRTALAAAYAFATLVAASSVISVSNVTPVRPFLHDWQQATTDPRAAHHSDELRVNSAIGAIAASAALLAVARRRRRPAHTHNEPTA